MAKAVGAHSDCLLGTAFQNALRHAGVIAGAASLRQPLDRMRRASVCDVGVLLQGETGTGKEVFAHAIHYAGHRASGPFVALNCGGIPGHLFENELFGHARGAYTDAREAAPGLIAVAENGTLLLDEIEALPAAGQAKLLRFLEDRRYRPLGSTNLLQANVRLIAATNEDLSARVKQRTFREDLYFRLRVVAIHLPPLRNRAEDLVPLVEEFLRCFNDQFSKQVRGLTPPAWDLLRSHSWPGNVRELRNATEAAVALSSGEWLEPEDFDIDGPPSRIGPSSETNDSMRAAKKRIVESFERDYLVRALNQTGGNIAAAARASGKNRRAFFALLKKYKLASA